jgi:hypothetical protein
MRRRGEGPLGNSLKPGPGAGARRGRMKMASKASRGMERVRVLMEVQQRLMLAYLTTRYEAFHNLTQEEIERALENGTRRLS